LSFPSGFSWRRLSPRALSIASWPTSWRRLTLTLVSGATLSIGLALILELLFELILVFSQGSGVLQSLNNPGAGNPSNSTYVLLLITVAVVAPLVEEMVKPLAVVVLIGRVKSKAEAFTLGLACGIGFNLVETTGYISQGYGNWLNVALVRSGAGLLHGFGAAMVALGWYILTHREEGRWRRRTLLALGCMGYAILQHAIWNGSFGLGLIPGPIGAFFSTWSWSVGPITIDGPGLINIAEAIGMLFFFIYMTGRLRSRSALAPVQQQGVQPTEGIYTAPA
jgi:RsiW-degrading membrane proteinase PrsW (M82 family)